MISEINPLKVHSLICHRDVEMGIFCLKSLQNNAYQTLNLILHDDGSLNEDDKSKLCYELPNSKIISRPEADEVMYSKLKNFPKSWLFRSENVMALKLFDVVLMDSGYVSYCDTDILFLKPFTNIFKIQKDGISAIFMQDHQDAYSIRPWHLSKKLKLGSRINAGIYIVKDDVLDLDFVEYLLGNKVIRRVPQWIEQTCWAALCGRVNFEYWDPKKIVIVTSKSTIDEQVVAAHFVSTYRYRINEFYNKIEKQIITSEFEPVETLASKYSSPLGLALSRLQTRINAKLDAEIKLKRLIKYANLLPKD